MRQCRQVDAGAPLAASNKGGIMMYFSSQGRDDTSKYLPSKNTSGDEVRYEVPSYRMGGSLGAIFSFIIHFIYNLQVSVFA